MAAGVDYGCRLGDHGPTPLRFDQGQQMCCEKWA